MLKVNNTAGAGGGAREVTAGTAQIEAVGIEDASIVSSRGTRSDYVGLALTHSQRDFKAKLAKFSGSREQWFLSRNKLEVFASTQMLCMRPLRSPKPMRFILMDMDELLNSDFSRRDVKDAETAFFFAFSNVSQDKD